MSDFIRDLRGELVSAAERAERRDRPRLAGPRLGPVFAPLAWTGAAAAALLVILAVASESWRNDERPAGDQGARPATPLTALTGRYAIEDPLDAPNPITGLILRPASDPRCAALTGERVACYELLALDAAGGTGLHEWGRVDATGDRIVLSAEAGHTCSGYPGTYRWTLSGRRLRLREVTDPCPSSLPVRDRREVLTRAVLRRGAASG